MAKTNAVWMKTALPGLALSLCCMAPASARDAGMSVYGAIDAGVGVTHGSKREAGAAAVSGGLTDTIFGIQGRENLPDGWSASFRLESLFDGTTGALPSDHELFGSAAWVGLGSDFAGQLRFGRQHPVGQQFGEQLEMASWKEMDLGATFKASDNYQVSQAVNYLSPSWGGLSFGAGYSFDVTGRRPGEGKSPSTSLALQYERGPWLFVATWVKTRLSGVAPPRAGNPQAWQLGVVYDADTLKAAVGWSRQRNGYASLSGGDPDSLGLGLGAAGFADGAHLDAYMAGLAVRAGAQGEVRLQWSFVKPEWHWATGRKAASGQLATLGYVHALSSRTRLYAMAGVAKRYSLENQVVQGAGTTVRYMAGAAHSF